MWMCDAGVPLDAVTYPSFQGMINAIGQYGVGVKPPTYYEERGDPHTKINEQA